MKKTWIRILTLSLCLCMLLGLVACGDKTADPTVPEWLEEPLDPAKCKYDEATNTWYITKYQELQLLRMYPDADFVVEKEIDCMGKVWTPVDNFTGTLSGVWGGEFNHTISNFMIAGKAGDTAVGLFRNVTGIIQDLNFSNVTVKVPTGFSGTVGLLAGTMKGDVRDVKALNITMELSGSNVTAGALVGELNGKAEYCYLTGKITGSLTGGENTVGGFVGVSKKVMAELESRVDITLNVAGKGNIGGIVGIMNATSLEAPNYGGKINVTAGDSEYTVSPLVGTLNGSMKDGYSGALEFKVTGTKVTTNDYAASTGAKAKLTSCVKRDLTNLNNMNMTAEEAAMRQQVVDYMYRMCTLPWTPSSQLVFDCSCGHKQVYEVGKYYFGQPYTHGCGSMERMEAWLDEDGMVLDTLPYKEIGWADWGVKPAWEYYLGNDCVDAIYWAWSQYSASIDYTLTGDMVLDLVEGTGIVKVGTYVLPSSFSDAKKPTTREIIKANQKEDILEAYAQLKPGDGVLYGPGHGRLVAEAPVVVYGSNGRIDPQKSYVVCHEQGGAVSSMPKRHTTCIVNKKYTFNQLFSGSYIPITVPELAAGKASTPEVTTNVTGSTMAELFAGNVHSNYRINYITVTVKDSKGNVVTTATEHPTGHHAEKQAHVHHNVDYELKYMKELLNMDAIQAGVAYQCTVVVRAGVEDVAVINGTFTG